MTTFPHSPCLLNAGTALIDSDSSAVRRIIVLRHTEPHAAGAGAWRGRQRSLGGAAPEGAGGSDIKLDAEIDATDQLELGDPTAMQLGIHPKLAALGRMIYPASSHLANNRLAQAGTPEIAPMEAPLSLFIRGKNRILPVRLTT